METVQKFVKTILSTIQYPVGKTNHQILNHQVNLTKCKKNMQMNTWGEI